MQRRREDVDVFDVVLRRLLGRLLGRFLRWIVGRILGRVVGLGERGRRAGHGSAGRMPAGLRDLDAAVCPHQVIDLDDDLRARIARHWLHRSASERGVSVAFTHLRPRLVATGVSEPVLALVDKAIDDEQRHADLCVQLASRYAGTDQATPPPRFDALPDFGTKDERLEVALIVTGMCCINESIASEWIRSCWQAATAEIAVAANREHLKDEIDHARLGWAHLASDHVDAATRSLVARRVPKMIEVNVAEWKRPDEHLPPEGVRAHGHLSREENDAVIDAAVRDVVLPGFALLRMS